MSDVDKVIIHLMKHYRGKILNLQSVLRRNCDRVDSDYILGMIDCYKKVIDDLDSLL